MTRKRPPASAGGRSLQLARSGRVLTVGGFVPSVTGIAAVPSTVGFIVVVLTVAGISPRLPPPFDGWSHVVVGLAEAGPVNAATPKVPSDAAAVSNTANRPSLCMDRLASSQVGGSVGSPPTETDRRRVTHSQTQEGPASGWPTRPPCPRSACSARGNPPNRRSRRRRS